jgi:transposase
LCWAEPFEKRTWAIESVGGMGYLLAQQLVARGEDVLDVPATLAARIRVLAIKRSNKNDPNDAHSIAIAALRAPALRQVEPADHAEPSWVPWRLHTLEARMETCQIHRSGIRLS